MLRYEATPSWERHAPLTQVSWIGDEFALGVTLMTIALPGCFTPARRSARWTQALLIAVAIVGLADLVSEFFLYRLLALIPTQGITEAEAAAADSRERIISLVQIALLIATAVAFLIWFHASYKNLPVLGGRGLKYSPRWAVGGFFVPLLNLIRPAQVMREVWHASDPSGVERDNAPDGPAVRNKLRAPVIIAAWWIFFIAASILSNTAARMSFAENQTLDELQRQTLLYMVADALDIPSALLGVLIVGRVTRWQSERYERCQRRTDTGNPSRP